jgi:DNA-binding response OmpR family regulator
MSLGSGITSVSLPQPGLGYGVPASGPAPSILVVDDDPALREMLGIILTSEGYEVQLCCSGNEAIRTMSRSPLRHQVVILDMTMSDGTGFDVLTWLAEHVDAAQRKQVVMATALPTPLPDWAERLVLTALRKPFGIDALLTVLSQCCYPPPPSSAIC